jgi:acylphosphatase
MSETAAELHAIITGRVQGVGYRYFVLDQAAALGLSGWTRNLPNGTVEVLAQGRQDSLHALLAALHRGPAGGHVDRVDSNLRGITDTCDGFRITR